MKTLRMWSLVCLVFASALAATAAKAQVLRENGRKITLSPADQQAAQDAQVIYLHARPANTPAGRAMKNDVATMHPATPSNKSTPAADSTALRFPGDVTYLGGPVVASAEIHAIYLIPGPQCIPLANCWGNPEGFLTDLASSNFVHLLDQYLGQPGSFTVGPSAVIPYHQSAAILTNLDIAGFVHAVASQFGSGFGHIYHVFLPPGQDECFSAKNHSCYSPDDPRTFVFCGFHSSVQFNDIGHVLFTVQPFQDVPGCAVRPGTPNGQLVDSADNILSHETFEAISDPDGDAWINISAVVLVGAEIGDECSFITFTPNGVFFDPSVFTIGSNQYAVQPEYSNSAHACAVGP